MSRAKRRFLPERRTSEDWDAVIGIINLIGMILFDNVAPRDVGFGAVLWSELFNVHAVFAALNLFFKNVNPEVMVLGQFPTRVIEENLDQSGSCRVSADLVA